MFGRRPDGRLVKSIDPIVALTPYLMPMRCDAQVMLDLKLDYEKMARYIVKKGAIASVLWSCFSRPMCAPPARCRT